MSIYHVLGSGSDANSYVFGSGENFYLIDAGFSCKQICLRLERVGIAPEKIKGIFLTHTHSDHIKGVYVFSRRFEVPVIGHRNLDYDRNSVFKSIDILNNQSYTLYDCIFTSFKTYHDSKGASGYHFNINDFKLTIITDTGYYCDNMIEIASKSDVIFLESNYDEKMLKNGSYPESIKTRIMSKYGHLSNSQACSFITELNSLYENNNKTTKQSKISIYLCHLSGNNNSLKKVEKEISLLSNNVFDIKICPRGDIVYGQTVN